MIAKVFILGYFQYNRFEEAVFTVVLSKIMKIIKSNK